MKVKTVKSFIDKHTKKVHLVGDTFEVDDKRLAEIKKVGNLVEVVAEPKKEVKSK